jgi:hypothetical protein
MAHAPVILPDGRVVACFGPLVSLDTEHPLALGDLREESIEAVLDRAEQNVVLHAIRLWGPAELIRRAREAGLGANLPTRFVANSVCSACYALLTEPTIVQYLTRLQKDAEFRNEVAWARVYYMNERRMLEVATG